jgi:hypothetical protein
MQHCEPSANTASEIISSSYESIFDKHRSEDWASAELGIKMPNSMLVSIELSIRIAPQLLDDVLRPFAFQMW